MLLCTFNTSYRELYLGFINLCCNDKVKLGLSSYWLVVSVPLLLSVPSLPYDGISAEGLLSSLLAVYAIQKGLECLKNETYIPIFSHHKCHVVIVDANNSREVLMQSSSRTTTLVGATVKRFTSNIFPWSKPTTLSQSHVKNYLEWLRL